MRVSFPLPRGQFFELGWWPLASKGATFLLCLGTWIHLGRCGGRWWVDKL